MKEFAEIAQGATDVLSYMKTTKYTPDEKIAILRAAADTVNHVIQGELILKSMMLTFNNIHTPK